MAAEKGTTTLRYDGKLTRGAKIDRSNEYNVIGCVWKGRPVIAGGPENGQAHIFDAASGERLPRLPISGLVAGMCEGLNGSLWCAVSWGEQGVAWFDGDRWQSDRTIKPASIAYWPGVGMVAGSMVDGKVYLRNARGTWVEIEDMKCSKINRLIYSGGAMLAAASNPDTFAVLHRDRPAEIMARFEDQAQSVSGEQFDAGIAFDDPRGVILAWRSNDAGTYLYRLETDSAPAPSPTPPATTPFTPLVWLAEAGKDAKAGNTAPGTMKAYHGLYAGNKPGIYFETTGASDGDWWAAVTILRDGVYYTGPFDGLGNNPNGRKFKSYGNLYGGDKGGPLIARHGPKRSEAESRAYLRLRAGETYWVSVMDARSKVQYQRVAMVYPEKDR
jgi:hypothetical protein